MSKTIFEISRQDKVKLERVTIREVAQEANVSTSTVSRYLRQSGRVKKKLLTESNLL